VSEATFKCCICGEFLRSPVPVELLRMVAEHQKPCFEARLKGAGEVDVLKGELERYRQALDAVRNIVDRVK